MRTRPSAARFSASIVAMNALEAVVERGRREPAGEAQADAPVLPRVLDGDGDLGLGRPGTAVVAGDGHDLVAVQRHERLAAVVVDVR